MILFADNVYSRKLTNFLIRFHLRKKVRCYREIVPAYIPYSTKLSSSLYNTSVWVLNDFNDLEFVNLPSRLLNDIIFRAVNIHDDSILILSSAKETLNIVILACLFRCSPSLQIPLILILIIHAIIIVIFPIVVLFLFWLI